MEITGDIWKRMGTSIVWDAEALHQAAQDGVTVSLREALEWVDAMPPEPPDGVQTVVVTGLQHVVEVVGIAEARATLERVRQLVRQQSRRWPEAAIIFAVQDRMKFRVSPPSGSVLMRLPDGSELDLGYELWGGAGREANHLHVTRLDGRKRETRVPIGYWLRRVS